MNKSESEKDYQQSQQVEREFLTNEISILEHPDILDLLSGRIILWNVTCDSDHRIRRET